MIARPHVLVAIAFVAAALSGCVGQGDPPVQASLVAIPETGTVQGTVYAESLEGLADAQVLLIPEGTTGEEEALTTLTLLSGEYEVIGVPPGKYRAVARALGFADAHRAVTVSANKVLSVDLILVPGESTKPYDTWESIVGIVNSAAAWELTPAGVGCQVHQVGSREVKNCSGTRLSSRNGEIEINVTEDVETVLVEMRWTPVGDLGRNFKFDLMCPEVPRGRSSGAVLDPDHVCYFDSPGTTSPLIHRIDAAHWRENGYNFTGDWAARVFAAHGMLGTYDATGVDVGLAYEQSFEIFVSLFHKRAAPPGHTGIPDS